MTGETARRASTCFQKPKPAAETASLSNRETEVLEAPVGGRYRETAEKLSLPVHTVRFHLLHMYEKFHAGLRAEVAQKG